MSSTMYFPACAALSQPVLAFVTLTIAEIEVPCEVVPSWLAQYCWVCRSWLQPHAIICIDVGPHQ